MVLKKHFSLLQAINDLYNIRDSISTENYLLKITEELGKVYPKNKILIGLVSDNTKNIEIEALYGIRDKVDPIPIGRTIMGLVIFHNKPFHIKSFKNEDKVIPIESSSNSAIAFPLVLRESAIGVLNIESIEPDSFSEEDILLISLITKEITNTISNMWLKELLKDKTKQLESLNRLSNQLVASLNKDTILLNLAQEAKSLLGANASAFFILDEKKAYLNLHTMIGEEGKLDYEAEIDTSNSAMGTSIRRKKQIEIHNILNTEENNFNSIINKEALHSMLITPISFKNESIGVLIVYSKIMRRFSNDEKTILLSIADLGAITLENARLYEKTFTSEEILRKNEKLTTLGLISAEIAHEIRNPLTVIKLLFQTLDLKFENKDPKSKDVELITEKINQLETIVERVLEFGNVNNHKKTINCLNRITEETLQLIRLKLKQLKIDIDIKKESEDLLVNANKGQLQQVILNLIFNSCQALPESNGLIKIKLFQKYERAYFLITDNGHGIPKDIKAKIFDSFLTSKNDGTGLGLAISKQILATHRGNIKLSKSNSKGTTFEFSVPLLK